MSGSFEDSGLTTALQGGLRPDIAAYIKTTINTDPNYAKLWKFLGGGSYGKVYGLPAPFGSYCVKVFSEKIGGSERSSIDKNLTECRALLLDVTVEIGSTLETVGDVSFYIMKWVQPWNKFKDGDFVRLVEIMHAVITRGFDFVDLKAENVARNAAGLLVLVDIDALFPLANVLDHHSMEFGMTHGSLNQTFPLADWVLSEGYVNTSKPGEIYPDEMQKWQAAKENVLDDRNNLRAYATVAATGLTMLQWLAPGYKPNAQVFDAFLNKKVKTADTAWTKDVLDPTSRRHQIIGKLKECAEKLPISDDRTAIGTIVAILEQSPTDSPRIVQFMSGF
jgi:hypothetical protein